MEVVFEETKAFLRDVKRLDPQQRADLAKSVNGLVERLEDGRHTRALKLRLPWSLTSSLYVSRVGRPYRLIHSIDPDPIFDELVVRLYRFVKHDRLYPALDDLMDKLAEEDEIEVSVDSSEHAELEQDGG